MCNIKYIGWKAPLAACIFAGLTAGCGIKHVKVARSSAKTNVDRANPRYAGKNTSPRVQHVVTRV